MALSWRHSTLKDRHRALGSKLEDWSGMGTAWTYDKDIYQEHIAIRTKAGLMDVSGLKKMHLVGAPMRFTFWTILRRGMSPRSIPASRSMPVC